MIFLTNNRNYSITFPYQIGTVMELSNNSNILAELKQYRVTIEHYKKTIYVLLSTKIYDSDLEYNFEITLDELNSNWKKTNQIVFKGSIGTKLDLGDEFINKVKTLSLK